MTYASLQNDISIYIERTDEATLAMIPTFIMLGQYRCARELKTLLTVNYVTASFQAGNAVYDKPQRWLEGVSWNMGVGATATTIQRSPLFLRTYDYIRSYWPNTSERGTPAYYADYDINHWIVAPTPDQNYPFEVAYYERPEMLSESNQQNLFTMYAPDALLYASLLETPAYLRTDERTQIWQMFFDRAKAALGVQDQGRSTDSQTIGGRTR
jgi:hypothetical protein